MLLSRPDWAAPHVLTFWWCVVGEARRARQVFVKRHCLSNLKLMVEQTSVHETLGCQGLEDIQLPQSGFLLSKKVQKIKSDKVSLGNMTLHQLLEN